MYISRLNSPPAHHPHHHVMQAIVTGIWEFWFLLKENWRKSLGLSQGGGGQKQRLERKQTEWEGRVGDDKGKGLG